MSYQVLVACKLQLVSLHFPLSHIIYHFPFCIFIINFIYYLYCYCSYCQASNVQMSLFQGFSSAQPTRTLVVVSTLHCCLCYCIVVIVLSFRYKAYELLFGTLLVLTHGSLCARNNQYLIVPCILAFITVLL